MSRRTSSPEIFRILLPAKNLATAQRFYEALLGVGGRMVAPGRVYFDCGSVILGILDFSGVPERRRPKPTESVYFSTVGFDALYRRAKRLGCLSNELLHGNAESPLGRPVVRPWGERSFYVDDPTGNSLCFVESGTEFRGTTTQVRALRKALPS